MHWPTRKCLHWHFQPLHVWLCITNMTTIFPVPKNNDVTCLNDYRPIALKSIAMKCFERLVVAHINMPPHQIHRWCSFYCTPHCPFTPGKKEHLYVSSAFNTIVPLKLITKLRTLGLNTSLCNWILDFLTGRPQAVRVGNNTSSTLILNMGAPQGCVLSALLYSLFTHGCTARQDYFYTLYLYRFFLIEITSLFPERPCPIAAEGTTFQTKQLTYTNTTLNKP